MPNAWVTGAGKGIGRALALELAVRGWSVAASARTCSDLLSLVNESSDLRGNIYSFPLDVTVEENIGPTVTKIEAEHGPIELAVLNAGTHEVVGATEFQTAIFRRLMDVNFFGTVNCAAEVVPRFCRRNHGHVAVVSSVAGYRGLPTAAAYGATKAALINMCESFYPELALQGVKITVINPGFVRTPLTSKNKFPMPFIIDPATAATRIIAGLESNSFEITFPRRFTWILKVLRILPYAIYFKLMNRFVA